MGFGRAAWSTLFLCAVGVFVGGLIVKYPDHTTIILLISGSVMMIAALGMLFATVWPATYTSRKRFARKMKVDWVDYMGGVIYDDNAIHPQQLHTHERKTRNSRRYDLGVSSPYLLGFDVNIVAIEPDPGPFKDQLPVTLKTSLLEQRNDRDGYILYSAHCCYMERVIWNNDPPTYLMQHAISGLTKELPQGTQRFQLEAIVTLRRALFGIPHKVMRESRWIQIDNRPGVRDHDTVKVLP